MADDRNITGEQRQRQQAVQRAATELNLAVTRAEAAGLSVVLAVAQNALGVQRVRPVLSVEEEGSL